MKTSVKMFFTAVLFLFGTAYLFAQVTNNGDMGGWFKAGSKPDSYETGHAMKQHLSKDVYYIKSTEKYVEGFGTIMTGIKPDEYFGKRVKLSGWIRTEDVAGYTGMWMRVDGSTPNEMLAFDNMGGRPIKGTTDWEKYEIVLEVGASATWIAYGILISGTGNVWLSDLTFEEVGSDVASTNTLTEEYYNTFKNTEQMPPELANIPNGIEVGHNPQTVSAVYNDKDSMYYWVYKTTIKPVNEDIEITQFGSYGWAGDHWEFGTVTGKPFEPKDFAEWYECKDAKMKKGKEYSDKNNWNNARVLQGSKSLWYYIGKNKKGELFKGTAIVNSLPEIKKK
jgi:hypothetical protein